MEHMILEHMVRWGCDCDCDWRKNTKLHTSLSLWRYGDDDV